MGEWVVCRGGKRRVEEGCAGGWVGNGLEGFDELASQTVFLLFACLC